MAEIKLQENGLEGTFVLSLLCEKNRRSTGFWEQICESCRFLLEEAEEGGPCSTGHPERIPDAKPLRCAKGGEGISEKKPQASREMSGQYYIVSNTGVIYGEYDRQQRL